MGLDNPIHIAFLLILLLLVFGAKRLPEMGKSLGHGMRGFKDALSGEQTPVSLAAPAAAPAATPLRVEEHQSADPRVAA
jgi:sec-independent protein translocase protein TatA